MITALKKADRLWHILKFKGLVFLLVMFFSGYAQNKIGTSAVQNNGIFHSRNSALPGNAINHSLNKIPSIGRSQNVAVNWVTHAENLPGNIKAFEQNKGQYKNPVNNDEVLYGCLYNGATILFTERGFIYSLEQSEYKGELKGEEWEKMDQPEMEEEREGNTSVTYHNIIIDWKNANPHPRIEAIEETPFYFGGGDFGRIKGYRKLLYHDVYPGVDVEFKFHDEKGNERRGIEYSIHLKAGTDPSIFIMHYSGIDGLKLDNSGALHIATPMGDIIDHAPVSFQGDKKVNSSFQKLDDNEVSFALAEFNTEQPLVIDPWLVSPTTGSFAPVDLGVDAANNVYILGAYASAGWNLRQFIQKYTNAGVLAWTYQLTEYQGGNSDYSVSDLVVSPAGDSYVATHYQASAAFGVCGGNQYGMVSVNTGGVRNYFYCGAGTNNDIFETWNLAYSCNYSTLIQGGCAANPGNTAQAAVMNPANGTLGAVTRDNTIGEIYAGTVAPNGYYYALAADSNVTATTYTPTSGPHNRLLCFQITGASVSLLWSINTNYSYVDFSEHMPNSLGTNGVAAGCSYLYTTDGVSLDQRNLSNGVLIKRVTIPGGVSTGPNINSGIAVDILCGNVYVGSKGAVYFYDANLNSLGSYNVGAANITFDVKINNGIVSACGATASTSNWGTMGTVGQGFVVQFNALTCTNLVNITHTDAGTCSLGTATANPSFCSPPYSYLWNPTGQTSQTATGLTPGTYTVQVRTQGSCATVIDSVKILSVAGGNLAPIIAKGTPNCSGTSNGSVTVSPNGGVGPYNYTWSPSGGTSATIANPAAGTYTVTVSDSGSCTGTSVVVVTQYTPLSTTINGSNISCPGYADGSAIVSATGGRSPYIYVWSPAGGLSASANGLTAGTYTVTVTDNIGCTKTAGITITQPPPGMTLTTTGSTIPCGASNIGTVSVTVSGATGSVTYSWSNGGTTQSQSGLNPGTYTVTVRDGTGCRVITTAVVSQVPSPAISTISKNNPTCKGYSNGNATSFVSSGTTPYTYSWSNGRTNANPTGLSAGIYTLTVTDKNGCTDTRSVTINDPSGMTLTVAPVSTPCGSNTGSASVTVSGGTGTKVYSWSTGSSARTITSLSAGTYTITVTDAKPCSMTSVAVVTNTGGTSTTSTVVANVSCTGGNDGVVSGSVSGGTTPYTYSWSSGASTQTASGLAQGTYTVTTRDALGCLSISSVTITQPPAVTVSITPTSASCGKPLGSAVANAGGGTGSFVYTWSNGVSGQTATGLSPGTYTVTATDAKSCTKTATVVIGSSAAPAINSLTGTPATCSGNNNGSATVSASGGSGALTYSWSNGTAGVSTLTGLAPNTYTVTVRDAGGCSVTATVTIVSPSPLNGQFTKGTANCTACGCKEWVMVAATGGTFPYTYSWSSPAGYVNRYKNQLCPGTYIINIKDKNNCSINITVGAP